MLNKPIILALLVLFSFCCLFGYLSYKFYGQKTKAEVELAQAVQINANLQDSLVKKEQECKITDNLVSEWQKEKDDSNKQKDSDIQKIDSIPKKGPTSPKMGTDEKTTDEVDIDGRLPDSFISVLSDSCRKNGGTSCANP
ncbi:hypothetical protein D3C85_732400 [compost metagenome]